MSSRDHRKLYSLKIYRRADPSGDHILNPPVQKGKGLLKLGDNENVIVLFHDCIDPGRMVEVSVCDGHYIYFCQLF
jgi:hypothetical protein